MLPIYVISMKESLRRDACARQLDEAGLGFVFHEATDGRSLPPLAGQAYDGLMNDRAFKRPLAGPEIGCYLSHRSLWERIAESGRAGVVLEDDFLLQEGFSRFLAAAAGYDLSQVMVKLDGERGSRRKFRRPPIAVLDGGAIMEFEVVSPYTTGYIIGAEAARRLRAVRHRFFRPVDIDLKHVWEHGVPVLGVSPFLLQEDASTDSSIDAARRAMKPKSGVQRLVQNLAYQGRFHWRRFTHNIMRPRTNLRPLGQTVHRGDVAALEFRRSLDAAAAIFPAHAFHKRRVGGE